MSPLPEVHDTFEWLDEPWGPALTCRALGQMARHVFTSRHLQLSGTDDWTSVASSMGVAPDRVIRLKQVHGASVVVVPREAHTPASEHSDGDALVSDDPSVALAVRVADCAPILLADTDTNAVGAVHAGWRGTAAGIVTATVKTMGDRFGTKAGNLVVAIGPAIGRCCYDVGPELVDAFAAHGHARDLIDRWFLSPPPRRGESGRATLRLDLAGANRDQLLLAGVPEHRVYVSGLCTAMHLDVLTSFRAEKEHAGRLAGVIRGGHRAHAR
jgi:YfiH family protein